MDRQRRERAAMIVAAAILTAIGVSAIAVVGGGLLDSFFTPSGTARDRPFARPVWLDHRGPLGEDVRGEMSLDLMRRVIKVGRSSRRQIRLLLGPPDVATPSELTYYIGRAPRFVGGELDFFFGPNQLLVRSRRLSFGGF